MKIITITTVLFLIIHLGVIGQIRQNLTFDHELCFEHTILNGNINAYIMNYTTIQPN